MMSGEQNSCFHDLLVVIVYFRFYQQYLDHLAQMEAAASNTDTVRKYAEGYEDFLQSPLQPLMDNLDSGTYEVFEKDPIKYSEYQRAIHDALRDRVTDEEVANGKEVVIMVLGAGRGPLVRASLKAANISGRKVRVFAVEKNSNAIVTLLAQKEEEWGDRVEVVSGKDLTFDKPGKSLKWLIL